MSRTSRNIVVAAAALMTLGTIALTSNDASARGFGGGGFRGGGNFQGHVGGGGLRHIGGGGGNFRVGMIRRPIFVPRWPHRHVFWRPHWRPSVVIGAPLVGATTYAAYSSGPAYNRCTCLSKEYTPEGAVLFKDVCTQESAINPPVADQTAYQTAPQVNPQPQIAR